MQKREPAKPVGPSKAVSQKGKSAKPAVPSSVRKQAQKKVAAAAFNQGKTRMRAPQRLGEPLFLEWILGYVWIGDGTTLGVAGKVYLVDPTQTYILNSTTSGRTGICPILPMNTYTSQTHVANELKQYSRVEFDEIRVEAETLQGSSQINEVLVIAPVAGNGGADENSRLTGTTGVPLTWAQVATFQKSGTGASYDNTGFVVRASKNGSFISGGSGEKENRFTVISIQGLTWGATTGGADLEGVVPMSLAIAGNTGGVASGITQNGTATHAIRIKMLVRPVDYIGAAGAIQVFPMFDVAAYMQKMYELDGERALLTVLKWVSRDYPYYLKHVVALIPEKIRLQQSSKSDLNGFFGQERRTESSIPVDTTGFKKVVEF